MSDLAMCEIIRVDGRLYMFIDIDDSRYATLVDIQDNSQICIHADKTEFVRVGMAKISVK